MTSGPTVLSTCYWLFSLTYSCYANCISHLAPSCPHIFGTGLACKQSCSFTGETGIVSGKVLNVPLLSEYWLSPARLRSSVRMNSSYFNFRWRKRRVAVYYLIRTKALKHCSTLVLILKPLWHLFSGQLFRTGMWECSFIPAKYYFAFQVY